ncbi:methylated-DNA--protein-cysteine methyltransferase [Zymomonas mobilis subsp. mobilis ZM4 = ATCC 31821]|uniref:Methylated-DNA/protein-cysteine methyltransferase n=2 Tax=Zymomonas mobilis subsp. mobilis TaxID=120045 RepID=Q5NKZ7_ZYMMO|nr:methylated-DNA--[protein]-cysteine S-methyltransferase [Zymomonas mobilis]AAV90613.1 methylated-DNA/protein-cysteine methyltransferase [Zymomonas mobilis subsp. mobilis ZM4 = ATCC 31821]ACV75727.1 methylated-DNA/protein-cysteine methyltransferase [Zymomonas mobilis subsp. mobilis NCIMB 11163]ART93649.1 cysteine methyltransferase [Zymomonas mobilis subsp. mobilis]AVZ26785.1 methylated-DNA--protein-cysteine methyltransferase [Zymomonas mobilis subsp. mobilis]AVZ28671.1 methylated-DNA--protein
MMPQLYYPTIIGLFSLQASDQYLERVAIMPPAMKKPEKQDLAAILKQSPLLKEVVAQIEAYFTGKVFSFDLPLQPAKTARGEAIRQALCQIPYGETASYRQLAIKAESGARAIGQACARNPLALIVPCHRIIKADGSLGQYSAGEGITTKAWLIDHERLHRGSFSL